MSLSMDPEGGIPMPDMNVPRNLEFYRQIIKLETDPARDEILFQNLNHSEQRNLQAIAHSRKLEYEYHRGCARVHRKMAESNFHFNIQTDLAHVGGAAPAPLAQPISQPQEHNASFTFGSSNIHNRSINLQEPSSLSNDIPTPGFGQFSEGFWQPSWLNVDPPPLRLDCFDSQKPNANLDSHMDMDMLYDQSIPPLDLGYPLNANLEPEPPYSSRRASASSTTFEDLSAIADMRFYEDQSASISRAPVLQSDYYPPTSRRGSLMSSTQLSPVASPRLTPLTRPEPALTQNSSRAASVSSPRLSEVPRAQNYKPTSRSGSVSSVRSDRGRTRISKIFKRSSSGSMYSPGFGENVFGSNTPRSASRASSGRGRTGPLDYLARVGMKAVKAVGGACWRCKILGKKCSDEEPCDSCPKHDSTWKTVGCKRGTLADQMKTLNLCPTSYAGDPAIEPNESSRQKYQCRQGEHCTQCPLCKEQPTERYAGLDVDHSDVALCCVKKAIHRRDKDITNDGTLHGDPSTPLGSFLQSLGRDLIVEDLGLSYRPLSPYSALSSLIPLDQCILAIIWEMLDQPLHISTLSLFQEISSPGLPNFVVFLRSAAIYQARLQSDPYQLIAQALICLRQSLETFRVIHFCACSESSHQACDPALETCKVTTIANLNSSLAGYIHQLSIVFFKKENLRGKSWWMSVFYSLVIQSVVRKSLISLVNGESAAPSSIMRYLHLAVRLFIASSSGHDPIAREVFSAIPQTTEDSMLVIQNHEATKRSIGQKDWILHGFHSSGEYLQRLFEDDLLPIESEGEGPLHHDSTIQPTRGKRWSTGSWSHEKRPSSSIYHNALNLELPSDPRPHPLRLSIVQLRQTPDESRTQNFPSDPPSLNLEAKNFENPSSMLSNSFLHMLRDKDGLPMLADYTLYQDLPNPPNLRAALQEEIISPPPEDMNPKDPDLLPHENELRFEKDIYTPRWIRGHGNKREGWCGLCRPGRWLVIKNSAFWYDKSFTHGISAATGSLFQAPREMRRVDGNPDVWEGLCASCDEWIAVVASKKKGTTWFRHAYTCHTHPKAQDRMIR